MPRKAEPITEYPLPGHTTFIRYAAHREISTARLSQIISAGILEGCYIRDEIGRFHIDEAKADEELNRPTPEREMAKRKREEKKAMSQPNLGAAHLANKPPPEKKEVGNYSDARTGNEILKFQMAKLAYEEKKGSLVSAEKVNNELYIMARTLREQLMNIPHRLAAIFSAEKDENKIRIMLDKEIRKAISTTDKIVNQKLGGKSEGDDQ